MNARTWNKTSVFSLAALCLLMASASGGEKLKIFILAGQSNTVGHARAHTIATLYQSDAARDKELLKLVFTEGSEISKQMLEAQLAAGRKLDDLTGGISNSKVKALQAGPEKTALEADVMQRKEAHEAYKQKVADACVVSDRVTISSIADRNKRSGKLGIGYGADPRKIGPEYGFGLSIAERVDGPILLIKCSWGGKSLHYDFRPPSAGPYELNEKEKSGGKADQIKQNAGRFYRMMNEAVHTVLNNLKDHHPDYDAEAGHEIAGFVWFQGFNDQFSPAFRDNYRANMVHFIKDVRKEYRTPKLPFVIGVLGTSITAEKVAENAVSLGQREAAKAPEFRGNVAAVESYKLYSHFSYEVFKQGWPEHFYEWDTVGSDRPFHYLGSGAFFVRLGDAFAESMADLIRRQRRARRPTPPVRRFDAAGAPPFEVLQRGENPPLDAYGNFVIGPEYVPAAEREVAVGVPQGKVQQFTIDSRDTKIFNPGIARKKFGTVDPNNPKTLIVDTHAIDYQRQITVYTPASYQPGTEAPFMVVHDGPKGKPQMVLPHILDNLIHQKRIPPIVLVQIANGGGDAQGHQRGREYDNLSGLFAEYIETEVLPRVEENCQVKLTRDPDGRAAMGSSSGGSAALIMAWFRTDLYRRVLTTSGTFVNQAWPFDPEYPDGAWGFHKTLIPASPKKPIRLFISVGDRDNYNPNVMRDGMHDWVEANHRMAKVLKAKGYEYQYLFCRNSGHGIRNAKEQFLPHAIEWVWAGYGSE